MKNKIKLYFILLTLISLLSFMVMTIFWINNRFLNVSRNNLTFLLNSTSSLINDDIKDYDTLAKNLSKDFNEQVRITIIDRYGNVLGESKAKYNMLENHLSRDEVKLAIKNGFGESIRKSETTGLKTLYVAKILKSSNILRFSMPISETKSFSYSIVPLFFLNIVIIFLFLTVLIDKTSNDITEPLKNMFLYMKEKIITGKSDITYLVKYEEVKDLENCFNELFESTQLYISKVRRTANDIQNIMDSMQEGFIMLDKDTNIIMINDKACGFLKIKKNNTNIKIQHVYRNIEFKKALDSINFKKENMVLDISQNKDVLRFYLNSANDGGYVVLISDVTELVRLDNMRSDFTSNVTHELKTPLTSISGFAELISTGMITDPKQILNFNEKILSESKRMIALVEDILKLSDIENCKTIVNKKINLKTIFIYVFEVLRNQLMEKNITFEIEGDIHLYALEKHIYELVFNLVGNAIKYNINNGKIIVNMFEIDNKYCFTIKDSGLGIPKKDIVHIFERFYRVDNARGRKTGGTGLGLAIVKHIVELYNGEIKVSSDNNGTEFLVCFCKK